MHRPQARLASLGAMLAGLFAANGQNNALTGGLSQAAENAGDAMLDLLSAIRPSRTRSRGTGRKNYNKPDQSTAHYRTRQMLKKRWLEGKKVPRDVVEAMEAATARRAPILERRAYAWRRQTERKVLDRFMEPAENVMAMKKLERVRTPLSPGEQNILDKARELYLAWQNREPFPSWAMEGNV